MEILRRHGVPNKLLSLIIALHVGAQAKIKINCIFSEDFDLYNGLKQGSVFAPLLFKIFFGTIINAIRNELKNYPHLGLRITTNINGNPITLHEININQDGNKYIDVIEISFADDVVIMTSKESHLQLILSIFDKVCTAFGQEISAPKTKIMLIQREQANGQGRREPIIYLRGQRLEVVDQFKYLGSVETSQPFVANEIKVRQQRMIAAFSHLSRPERIFRNKNVTLKARLHAFNALVLPCGFYGAPAWNFRSSEIKQLESTFFQLLKSVIFKWKCWRNDEDTSHISYEMVLKRAEDVDIILYPIEAIIRKLQLRFIGHILRQPDTNLVKLILFSDSLMKLPTIGNPQHIRRNILDSLKLFGFINDHDKRNWMLIAMDEKRWNQEISSTGLSCFMRNWKADRAVQTDERHRQQDTLNNTRTNSTTIEVSSLLPVLSLTRLLSVSSEEATLMDDSLTDSQETTTMEPDMIDESITVIDDFSSTQISNGKRQEFR